MSKPKIKTPRERQGVKLPFALHERALKLRLLSANGLPPSNKGDFIAYLITLGCEQVERSLAERA